MILITKPKHVVSIEIHCIVISAVASCTVASRVVNCLSL